MAEQCSQPGQSPQRMLAGQLARLQGCGLCCCGHRARLGQLLQSWLQRSQKILHCLQPPPTCSCRTMQLHPMQARGPYRLSSLRYEAP